MTRLRSAIASAPTSFSQEAGDGDLGRDHGRHRHRGLPAAMDDAAERRQHGRGPRRGSSPTERPHGRSLRRSRSRSRGRGADRRSRSRSRSPRRQGSRSHRGLDDRHGSPGGLRAHRGSEDRLSVHARLGPRVGSSARDPVGRVNRDRAAEDRVGGRPWGERRPARDSRAAGHRGASNNPQQVPRRGYFFEHDDRGNSRGRDRDHRHRGPPQRWARDHGPRHRTPSPGDKWTHDKFEELKHDEEEPEEQQQQPPASNTRHGDDEEKQDD